MQNELVKKSRDNRPGAKGDKPSLIKTAVVGCGGVAQVIHLPILKRLKSAEITAVCDIDDRKAAIVADRFGIDNVFSDIEEMFDRCDIDAAFILTPNNMHLPMSLIALNNGAHVFIEKPAARNRKEAMLIRNAAIKNDRHVMVGMHSRFRPDLRYLHDSINRKRIGDIFFMKAEWLQAEFQGVREPWLLSKRIAGGGVLLDLGIQLIDTAWWLIDRPELLSVKAESHQINRNIEVEDFCTFNLTFDNKVKFSGHISWNFPIEKDRFYGEIFGASGRSSLNPFRIEKIWQGKVLDITPKTPQRGRTIFNMAYDGEITHFINFLTGRTPELESNIDEACTVLGIVDAIYESLDSKREVTIAGLKRNAAG